MEEIHKYKPEVNEKKIDGERIDRESLRDKAFIIRDYVILQSTLADNSHYAIALVEFNKKRYSVTLPGVCADKLKDMPMPSLVKLTQRISKTTKRKYWDFVEAD